MSKLLKDIEKYWTNRAEGYSKVNQEELSGEQREKWRDAILANLPDKNGAEMSVLDIGCGPGFFSIILAEAGMRVTAVDYTEEMLRQARVNAGAYAEKITWKRMDAQSLDFADGTFDAVVTRNVTWNLEQPEKAYMEWYRVLKEGGTLLNFDANWYGYLYEPELKAAYEQDRENARECQVEDYYEGTDICEMERIADAVPLSGIKRPAWDLSLIHI